MKKKIALLLALCLTVGAFHMFARVQEAQAAEVQGEISENGTETDEPEADENGFVIKDGVLIGYKGEGGEVTVPDSVESIGEGAFEHCSSLIGITIPNSVMSIGASAFRSCSKLANVEIPDSISVIERRVFQGCGNLANVEIPDSVRRINENAFSACSNLVNVGIPDSVNGIGRNAFSGCSSLTNIEIPDSVKFIEAGAFSGCSSLASVKLPGTLHSVSGGIFQDCSSLISIELPDYTQEIGESAFQGCSSLKTIKMPSHIGFDELGGIGEEGFIGKDAFYGCNKLTDIKIPAGTTRILDGAFQGCSSLKAIEFLEHPENEEWEVDDDLTRIGKNAFSGCSSLASIKIPNSVNLIDESAFYGCSSLLELEIPLSMGIIFANAFRNCSSLVSVEIPDSVTSIGGYAFEGCGENFCIYCNEGSYAEIYAKENSIAYKTMKKCQTITGVDFTKTVGDPVFSIGATTDGDGILSYQSDNDSVASVTADGIVAIAGIGTVRITISASETDAYKAAEIQITITVNPKQDENLGGNENSGGNENPGGNQNPGENENPGGNQNPGENQQPGGSQNLGDENEMEQEPKEKIQTITAKDIIKTYGAKSFSLGAKASGGGKLTYTVENKKVATVDKNGKVSIKGCGKTEILIEAAANGAYGEAEETITLTVKPKKMKLTSVKSTGKKTITVKWKKDAKVSGYVIQCSTDKKFKKNVKAVTVSKYNATSKKITKLKAGKKYYVRACAYAKSFSGKIKGSYSAAKKVTVKK